MWTLQQALEKVGGFGAYQKTTVVLLAILHSFSAYQVYTFGYLTRAPPFLCREGDSDWQECKKEEICAPGFSQEWKFDTSDKYYLKNFFTEMDMTCWKQSDINWMVQLQFVGFFFGTPLFLILEKFGRIKALNLIIPILLLGTWLVMQTDSYNFMCIGFFLQGIGHIKKPLSYGFPIENCDKNSSSMGISIILFFDMLVMFFFQFGAIFITNDAIAIIRWACLTQSFVILLLPFFMLESPTWLIQNRRNDEARTVLNKIAEFNGKDKSNYVPKHVKLVLKPLDEKQEGAV